MQDNDQKANGGVSEAAENGKPAEVEASSGHESNGVNHDSAEKKSKSPKKFKMPNLSRGKKNASKSAASEKADNEVVEENPVELTEEAKSQGDIPAEEAEAQEQGAPTEKTSKPQKEEKESETAANAAADSNQEQKPTEEVATEKPEVKTTPVTEEPATVETQKESSTQEATTSPKKEGKLKKFFTTPISSIRRRTSKKGKKEPVASKTEEAVQGEANAENVVSEEKTEQEAATEEAPKSEDIVESKPVATEADDVTVAETEAVKTDETLTTSAEEKEVAVKTRQEKSEGKITNCRYQQLMSLRDHVLKQENLAIFHHPAANFTYRNSSCF